MVDQIMDACCLINVWASGNEASVLRAGDGSFHVSDQVRQEAITVRRIDPQDASKLVPARIDLSEAMRSGLIQPCRPESEAEYEAYVRFAAEIDDGEASCLAIALSRHWTIATDDRKATRLALEAGITVVTTPELLQKWVSVDQPGDDEVAEALRNIERFARFRPRRSSPLYQWWSDRSEHSGS